MGFVSVLDLSKQVTGDHQPLVQIRKKAAVKKERGCEFCPMGKAVGIKKIKGLKDIKQKKIFIWTQSPSKQENKEGVALVGPAGQMMWEELDTVGITRDMCDVQQVVRCWPTVEDDHGYLKDRAPSKEEIYCCSKYTDRALELNERKATLHLVFGQVAAKSLLGREYKKSTPVFWSEKLQAKVVVLDHPNYFLRGAPRERLQTFREHLRVAGKIVTGGAVGKFAFIDKQKYKLALTLPTIRKVFRMAMRQKSNRVSVDIEDGIIDTETGKATYEGTHVLLTVAVCWKPGEAWCIPVDHPGAFHKNRRYRRKIIRLLSRLMRKKGVKKTLHHGTHDVKRMIQFFGIKVNGYDFDTNYSTYLKWPDKKKYGLEEMARSKVTQFAEYKDIIKPYLDPERPNYATIPLKVIKKYNCADADLGKRLEIMTQGMAGPLLQTYTKAAFVIDDMQTRGPYLDKRYYADVASAIPRRLKKVKSRLEKLSIEAKFKNKNGSREINLNAPQQCAIVIYDKLKCPPVNEDSPRSTNADDLKILAQRPRGKFAKLLIEYRELSKMKGTYLDSYLRSAEIFDGQLRTLWWLTGTITGRLRSGGKEVAGIINMQNLHGEPMLKNLLISDLRWRRALKDVWSRIRRLKCFSAFDYAQIEIRVLAHMSGDKKLLAAVEQGDIHGSVGEELTGIPRAEIRHNEQIRTMIKGLHFGIVYGMTPNTLYWDLISKGIKITKERTQELYDRYFARFSRVRELVEHLRQFAEKHHYVETMFGFRRPINVYGAEDGRQTFWGNQAINSPIQGSAHTLMLIAMALMWELSEKYTALDTPVAEVHDALVFSHRTDIMEEVNRQGKLLLEKAVPRYVEDVFGFQLKFPLVCEQKVGYRLGSLAEFKPEDGNWKHFIADVWRKKNAEVEEKITKKWGQAA